VITETRVKWLREECEFSARNIRQPGYTQAIEHLQNIQQGYDLYTFNMVHSPSQADRAYLSKFSHDRWNAKFTYSNLLSIKLTSAYSNVLPMGETNAN
jgi:hypothetical protein